jgi:hypothetical protein
VNVIDTLFSAFANEPFGLLLVMLVVHVMYGNSLSIFIPVDVCMFSIFHTKSTLRYLTYNPVHTLFVGHVTVADVQIIVGVQLSVHVQYNVCDTHAQVSVAVSVTVKSVFLQSLFASSVVVGEVIS